MPHPATSTTAATSAADTTASTALPPPARTARPAAAPCGWPVTRPCECDGGPAAARAPARWRNSRRSIDIGRYPSELDGQDRNVVAAAPAAPAFHVRHQRRQAFVQGRGVVADEQLGQPFHAVLLLAVRAGGLGDSVGVEVQAVAG